MIYAIHKMLVLFQNYLNYLKVFSNALFSQNIMLESLSLEEENIIKDIVNLFRLKKKLKYTIFIYIKNLFRLEKETKAIKDRILTGI